MLKNFFKIAFRNLGRDKLSAFVNIAGLAFGIASVIVLFIFIRNELSYDNFHSKADHIYRLTYHDNSRDDRVLATTAPAMGPAMVDNFPEVINYTTLYYTEMDIMSYHDKSFYEDDVIYADSNFFQVFSFLLKKGDPKTALKDPNTVVVTPRMAKKYFGKEDPLGKTLVFNSKKSLKVTGVIEKVPQNSHLQFDFLVSLPTYELPPTIPITMDNWGLISFHNYLLLNTHADGAALEKKFDKLLASHTDQERADRIDLKLQPIKDIYYHSAGMKNNQSPAGNIQYTYGLSAIAVLIVIIAGFNFMNIATALSIKRSKEVGVRKALGAGRNGLVRQFLGESILVAMISLVLALTLVFCGKGFIEEAFDGAIYITLSDLVMYLPVFLLLTIVIGAFAGSYPAFMLSRFQPVKVLKGSFDTGPSAGIKLRKVLLLAQFTLTIAVIAASILISKQLGYLRDQNLGFDRESVIALQIVDDDNFLQHYRAAKPVLQQNPLVEKVSAGMIFNGMYGTMPVWSDQMSFDDAGIPMHYGRVYYDYLSTMGIKMVEGRDFKEEFATDSSDAVVINQAAAKLFGWNEPIGEKLYYGPVREGKVIGVTEDFNIYSLHKDVQPMILFIPESAMNNILVRINTDDIGKAIQSLKTNWQNIAPDMPFKYSFTDEGIQEQYLADQRLGNLLFLFSILTILVACLGLYGLASIITQFKYKEIGIRKVLGAGVLNISYLVSRQFLMLVVIANGIAWPLAYYYIDQWLANFTNSIEIGPWPFIAAGFITFGVALVTVSYHSVKAALLDPVKSIRNE